MSYIKICLTLTIIAMMFSSVDLEAKKKNKKDDSELSITMDLNSEAETRYMVEFFGDNEADLLDVGGDDFLSSEAKYFLGRIITDETDNDGDVSEDVLFNRDQLLNHFDPNEDGLYLTSTATKIFPDPPECVLNEESGEYSPSCVEGIPLCARGERLACKDHGKLRCQGWLSKTYVVAPNVEKEALCTGSTSELGPAILIGEEN